MFKQFRSDLKNIGWLSWLVIATFFISIYLLWAFNRSALSVSEWKLVDWFSFLQLVVISASAIIAFYTIHNNRKTSKEKATLEIILDDYKDDNIYQAKTAVYDFINDRHDRSKYTLTSLVQIYESRLESLSPEEKNLKAHMMLLLNRNEFYASGINSGLLDERLFKRVHCANIITLWEAISSVVMCIRKKVGKNTLFRDLEILATRWRLEPLKEEELR